MSDPAPTMAFAGTGGDARGDDDERAERVDQGGLLRLGGGLYGPRDTLVRASQHEVRDDQAKAGPP